jgi:multidrug efflux pump subunit AcrA (membrane-fusion protein)
MSGTVIARNALPGDLVSGGLSPFGGGQELAVIADTSTMVIKALIPEVDVARVREGQTATVRLDALRQRVFTGRIERIAPAPREQRGALAQFSTGESVWYEVQVHLDDTDPRLRTGMSANVDLTAETIHDVIYLPQEAIFEEMGRWYVWQVMDKQLAGTIRETPATVTDARGNIIEESSVRLEKKLVHIGAYNDLFTQIRTGLPEGTVVLIKPPLRGRRTFEIK